MEQLDSEQLLKWLVRELEPICSEEPDVLAQYVEALIKDEDMKRPALQKHCVSELTDFLSDKTEDFVERMFAAIDDGSYQLPSDSPERATLNDSIQEDSPPSNRHRVSSVSAFDADEEEEEESENHRRRKYQESSDEGNKRQR